LRWQAYAGGVVQHGYTPELDGAFAFDNETPRHTAYVAAFELAHRPLSNAECMAFIQDGGYQRPELWLSLGWDWVQAGQRCLPLYWQGDAAAGYQHFSLQGLLPVNPAAPVCHLSYFEADALARWSGARLPTELEWELAARSAPLVHQPAGQGTNFAGRAVFRPLPPVSAQQAAAPAQLWGDVWEWTQSPYSPYPGYRPWGGVVGEYNGKFMCQQFVLRGGSCATPQSHMRASYRNFFPPEAQWQFSGVRLARDVLA
jgi:ergothioneine biosynthesis protein EgtB